MDKLKPCPFCGGNAIMHNFKPVHEKRLWYISCHDCEIEQTNYLSEQEAIEAWNRRQAQDVPDTNVGDMVSRQTAIDALDQIFDRCEEIEAHMPEGDPDRTGYKMYPDYMTVWKYLHQLPSAQPDRCDTCRFVYYPKETNNDQ